MFLTTYASMISAFLFDIMLYLFTKIIEINNYIWYQLNYVFMLLNRGIPYRLLDKIIYLT